jgi:GTP cyclohydrolase IIa
VARLSRLTLVELRGYREWTESLGEDREWVIQAAQSRVYRAAQEEAKEHGAFIIPLRYDYMVILSSGVEESSQRSIVKAVAEASPVPVRAASTCSRDPIEALRMAQRLLARVGPGGLEVEACDGPGSEWAAVAHVDVDDITEATWSTSAYDAYLSVLRLHHYLAEEAAAAGAVVQYLGGDNILVILPPEEPLGVTTRLLSSLEGLLGGVSLKAGVGVSRTPRAALALAARALHDIRSGASKGRVVLYEEA